MSSNRYQLPDCRGCAFRQGQNEMTTVLAPPLIISSPETDKVGRRKKEARHLRRLRKQLFNTYSLIATLENHELKGQTSKKGFKCVTTEENISQIPIDRQELSLSSILGSLPISRLFTTSSSSLEGNETKVTSSQTWRVLKFTSRVSPCPYKGIGICNN